MQPPSLSNYHASLSSHTLALLQSSMPPSAMISARALAQRPLLASETSSRTTVPSSSAMSSSNTSLTSASIHSSASPPEIKRPSPAVIEEEVLLEGATPPVLTAKPLPAEEHWTAREQEHRKAWKEEGWKVYNQLPPSFALHFGGKSFRVGDEASSEPEKGVRVQQRHTGGGRESAVGEGSVAGSQGMVRESSRATASTSFARAPPSTINTNIGPLLQARRADKPRPPPQATLDRPSVLVEGSGTDEPNEMEKEADYETRRTARLQRREQALRARIVRWRDGVETLEEPGRGEWPEIEEGCASPSLVLTARRAVQQLLLHSSPKPKKEGRPAVPLPNNAKDHTGREFGRLRVEVDGDKNGDGEWERTVRAGDRGRYGLGIITAGAGWVDLTAIGSSEDGATRGSRMSKGVVLVGGVGGSGAPPRGRSRVSVRAGGVEMGREGRKSGEVDGVNLPSASA